MPTAILASCKQLHAEAATILYSQNSFGYSKNVVAAEYRHLVRKVTVDTAWWLIPFRCASERVIDLAMEVCCQIKSWSSVQSVDVILEGAMLDCLTEDVVDAGPIGTRVEIVAERVKTLCEKRGLDLTWKLRFVTRPVEQDLVEKFPRFFDPPKAEADCKRITAFAKKVMQRARSLGGSDKC